MIDLQYLYVMLSILVVNIAFIAIFELGLKVTTFDNRLTTIVGKHTGLLNTAIMFLVSVTVVAASIEGHAPATKTQAAE